METYRKGIDNMSDQNKKINEFLETIDLNAPAPAEEPARQFYFMKKARILVAKQEHVLGAVINDPLVIIYALHPELVRSVNKYVTVVTDGIALGQSIVDRADFWKKQPNATILQAVDAKSAMAHIISGLLASNVADIENELDNIATNLERLS